jgi:hypothetical protein
LVSIVEELFPYYDAFQRTVDETLEQKLNFYKEEFGVDLRA